MHPLKQATLEVLAALPEGAGPLSHVVIERYPDDGHFAYQWINQAGLNVATWIPDLRPNGPPQMQTANPLSPLGRWYNEFKHGGGRYAIDYILR